MDLNPDQDKRCEEIVGQALGMAPGLRRAFVVHEAAGDQPVLKAVLEILDLLATDLPTEFGAYEVIQHIGSGGMGDVYLARDPDIDRMVAIKVLKDWGALAETRRRFIAEARTLGKIDHPNVIKIFNYFPREKRPYFVMEYAKGESLASAIRSQRCGDFQSRVKIARQIADAGRAVHETGTVHRDIKTENVILTADGTPKLLDFGIARAETSTVTDPSLRVGTLANLPPEVIAGEPASAGSDIYAYGLLLFELFTEAVPFEGSRREILDGILGQGIALNVLSSARLPREMEELVRRSTAQDPRHRPKNFKEIVATLDLIPAATAAPQRPRWPGVKRTLIAAGMVLLVAGTLLLRHRSIEFVHAPHQAKPAPPSQVVQGTPAASAGDRHEPAPIPNKSSHPAVATNKIVVAPPSRSASRPKPPSFGDRPTADAPPPVIVALPPPLDSGNTPPNLTPFQPAQATPKGDGRARGNPNSGDLPPPAPAADGPAIDAPKQALATASPNSAANSRKAADDREQDRREVLAVLNRLAAAYRSRSVTEIAELWPTLEASDRQKLGLTFADARTASLQLTCEEPQLYPTPTVETRAVEATIRCRWLFLDTVNRGTKVTNRIERDVVVHLERRNGTWIIVEIGSQ